MLFHFVICLIFCYFNVAIAVGVGLNFNQSFLTSQFYVFNENIETSNPSNSESVVLIVLSTSKVV